MRERGSARLGSWCINFSPVAVGRDSVVYRAFVLGSWPAARATPKQKSCRVCVFVLCFLVFKQFVSFLPVAFQREQASVVDGTFNYFSLGSGQRVSLS